MGLKALRAEALSGVRDLIAHQDGGILICGRDHYFDSNEELFSALGLASSKGQLLRSKDEFTFEEITEFLRLNGQEGDIPEWLPRKPLTCEFFLRVFADVGAEISDELDLVQFWDLLIDAVCEREARIHPSFDVETIKRILVEVASITRMKSGNVGPISLSEIQSAFERVVADMVRSYSAGAMIISAMGREGRGEGLGGPWECLAAMVPVPCGAIGTMNEHLQQRMALHNALHKAACG
jgi:hypothetical protein